MAQPPGFLDPNHPEMVCKLDKSLYGLKQAHRAWNERFTAFLPSIGFKDTYSDSSLFVKTAGSNIVILLLYVDDIIITDWAGNPNDKRSTTGFIVFLRSNPISWSSKKQQTISRSSTEAKYRALSITVAELDWIQQLLVFLQVPISVPPTLFCDNLSTIALSLNPVQHQRTKHIEVDVHFVRERIAKKKLLVQFVNSREQYVDILTKGLCAPLFLTHCFNLMLGLSEHEILGGC
ncbi:unnamed protein product [Malus baccata var. baccata]